MIKAITNSKFDVIVFDLNGTLTNRVSDHPEHLAYRNAYIKEKTGKEISIPLPNETSLSLAICGLEASQYYHRRNDELDWNLFHSFTPSLLEGLKELLYGGYRLAIYTDCQLKQVEQTLEILRLSEVFDLIITGEDGLKKPNPEAFLCIARMLQCSPEDILMVGNDVNKDLLPLTFLGGNTIQVNGHQEMDRFFEFIAELNGQ